VHRWAYDYSVPGYHDDFIPQNVPADAGAPVHDQETNT
jgi:cytochrome c oxidase subunit 1